MHHLPSYRVFIIFNTIQCFLFQKLIINYNYPIIPSYRVFIIIVYTGPTISNGKYFVMFS